MKKMLMSVAIVLLFAGNVLAQLWSVEVIDQNALGMGTVVAVDGVAQDNGWRYAIVATASHVVENSKGIKIRYENGKSSSNCSVISRDHMSDLALVRCLVPPGVAPLKIGSVPAEEGDKINYVGRYRRKFSGDVSCLVFENEIWVDVVFVPGDSGGSVILNGELIGCISGGMMWSGTQPKRTYPGRSNNLKPLKKLVEDALKSESWKGASKQPAKPQQT